MRKVRIVFLCLILICCNKKIENQKAVKEDSFSMDRFLEDFSLDMKKTNDSAVLKDLRINIAIRNKKGWQYFVKNYGDIFKNGHKYFYVINQETNENLIYLIRDKKVIKAVNFQKEYPFDQLSIYDINKDGKKDLIITSPTTGPLQYKIFLLGKEGLVLREVKTYNYFPIGNKEFIEAVKFNSPVINLMKMKWNGATIDTIEKIYYNYNNPIYYKSGEYPFRDNENGEAVYDELKKSIILKELPKGYSSAINEYYPKLND